jgi:hypothetical protein
VLKTPQQQLQLQEQIAKEQAKLSKMAGPGFDPDKAARIEKRIADLQSQAPQQDMFGAKPQLLDLNARMLDLKDATQRPERRSSGGDGLAASRLVRHCPQTR